MKIVIDNAIPYISGVLEPYATVVYRPAAEISHEDAVDADMLIIRTRTRCDRHLLEGSRVRLIATATIGFDHIDLDYCAAHGIEVVTAQGCNAAGVLQWVGAALAALAADEGWQPQQKTLGIVGVGHVGSLVEEYGRMWGFRILRCDPPRQQREGGDFLPIEEVAAEADILTLHTPLDDTTRHLADSRLLSLMRPDATLMNAARGEVADTAALVEAPQRVVLDVWENEPRIDRRLLDKAFIATPHIAGYSAQGKANATAAVVRAAARHFALPLEGWYPPQATPVERRPITWEQMCQSIGRYFDIAQQTRSLKASPETFESMRNNYHLRQEYF